MGKISQSIICGASVPYQAMGSGSACLMNGGHFIFDGFMGMEPFCKYPDDGHTESFKPSCPQQY